MKNDNQILCGDAAELLFEYPSASIDMVVTDPPYLMGYKDRKGRTLANDTNPKAVLAVYVEIYRVLKNDSYCISFYGWNSIAEFSAKWAAFGFRLVGHNV